MRAVRQFCRGDGMTAKEAAKVAECSVSTLRRYKCAWCDQSLLDALRYGCGAIWGRCDPETDKPWPIHKQKKVAA